MNIIKFLFLFIFIHGCGCTGAFGQALKVGDFKTMSGVTYHQNFVKNPGAEFSVTSGIAVSGGALTRQPTSSSYGSGNYYFQWIPVAQNDTVTLYFDSLPGILSNSASRKNCQGKINIGTTASGPNASAGFKVGLYAGVTLIEEKTFSGNAAYTEQAMKELIFGATGCSRGIDRIIITNTGTVNPTIVFDEAWFSEFYLQTVQNRYFAKMYRGGSTQTGVGPNNNDFKILPNTLDFDQMGIVNLSTNRFEFNAHYTCNFSGRVSILNTNTLASTYYYAKIKKNGVDQAGGSLRLSAGAGQYVADPVTALSVNVVPGDYVELYLGSSGNNSVSTLTADIGNWNTFLAADCTPAASQAITPQNYSFNWVPYTPTISSSTGTVTNYNAVGEYRRDSDGKLYLRGTLTFTGAAGTWANPRIGYPSGVPVISMGALYLPGVNYTDTGVNSWSGHYQVDTNYLVLHGLTGTNGVGIAINQSNPFAFGNTDVIKWNTGPIDVTGWVSSQGAPQIVNSVTSNKPSSGWRGTATFGGASINTNCTSSPCELYNNPDPAFLKPTKNAGSGSYIINVAAGTCSTPLNCKATGVNVGSNVVRCDKSNFATTTTYGIDCSSPAGVANNAFVDIECSCDR